jgi:hypothetical protein
MSNCRYKLSPAPILRYTCGFDWSWRQPGPRWRRCCRWLCCDFSPKQGKRHVAWQVCNSSTYYMTSRPEHLPHKWKCHFRLTLSYTCLLSPWKKKISNLPQTSSVGLSHHRLLIITPSFVCFNHHEICYSLSPYRHLFISLSMSANLTVSSVKQHHYLC